MFKPNQLRITASALVPELKLHLLTPQDTAWNESWKNGEESEPFWAIFWPGGQVLTRFLYDSKMAKDKRGKFYFILASFFI